MKLIVMSCRDSAGDVFGQPFFTTHVAAAIRSFSDVINDPEKKDFMARHPSDFDLYELGTWDDGQSDFALLPQPRQVARGKDLLRPVPAR